jgi:DNA polymerase-4
MLAGLTERVTGRMAKRGFIGRTVVLRLRFADFTRASRSRSLVRATATTAPVLFTARALLAGAWPLIESRGLTLVGITMSGIEADSGQLELPLDGHPERALDDALDKVRDRFGTAAITRAALLEADSAMSAWLLPTDDPEDQAT